MQDPHTQMHRPQTRLFQIPRQRLSELGAALGERGPSRTHIPWQPTLLTPRSVGGS